MLNFVWVINFLSQFSKRIRFASDGNGDEACMSKWIAYMQRTVCMGLILFSSHTNVCLHKMRVCFFIVSFYLSIHVLRFINECGRGREHESPCAYMCIYICRFSAYNVNLHIVCSCLVLNVVRITVELMSCCLSCHMCSLLAYAHT